MTWTPEAQAVQHCPPIHPPLLFRPPYHPATPTYTPAHLPPHRTRTHPLTVLNPQHHLGRRYGQLKALPPHVLCRVVEAVEGQWAREAQQLKSPPLLLQIAVGVCCSVAAGPTHPQAAPHARTSRPSRSSPHA